MTEPVLGGGPGNAFVAIALEGEALAAAGAVLAEARAAVDGVRWTRPEGLHLTLHFFGLLPVDQHAHVLALLAPVAAAGPRLRLRMGELGRFPERGPARVLWMGVHEGREAVVALAGACGRALAAAGFAVDPRPHQPHCTLGRPRAWSAAHRDAWEGLRVPAQPAQVVERLVLLESQAAAPGANRYLPRGEVRVGEPPPSGAAGVSGTPGRSG